MYKKTIFTFLLFLAPIGIIERHKKDGSPRIINYLYDIIKNCLEEDLLSQNDITHLAKNFLHNFVRDEYRK